MSLSCLSSSQLVKLLLPSLSCHFFETCKVAQCLEITQKDSFIASETSYEKIFDFLRQKSTVLFGAKINDLKSMKIQMIFFGYFFKHCDLMQCH